LGDECLSREWPGYTQNATSFTDFTEVSLIVFFAGVLNRSSPDLGKAGINLRSAKLLGNTFFERFRLMKRLYTVHLFSHW
jgi:hypothetical protein